MQVATRFWSRLVIWTGLLLVILMGISLITGQAVREVVSHLPIWGGLALVLAAFPAGIAVSPDVLPPDRVTWRPLVDATLTIFSVCALVFVLVGFLGPALVQRNAVLGEGGSLGAGLHIVDLYRETQQAVTRAESGVSSDLQARWLPADSRT